MNTGKRFENNFKKSVPENIFYYRLKDGSSSWGGNDLVRFQTTNMCDSIMFDGNTFYCLELKSVKGKSLPFKNIKLHQINDLIKCTRYKNVIAGFIIDFSELDECYFIEISDFKMFYDNTIRKSVPIAFARDRGIKIDVTVLKVNKKYNVDKFINSINKELSK